MNIRLFSFSQTYISVVLTNLIKKSNAISVMVISIQNMFVFNLLFWACTFLFQKYCMKYLNIFKAVLVCFRICKYHKTSTRFERRYRIHYSLFYLKLFLNINIYFFFFTVNILKLENIFMCIKSIKGVIVNLLALFVMYSLYSAVSLYKLIKYICF